MAFKFFQDIAQNVNSYNDEIYYPERYTLEYKVTFDVTAEYSIETDHATSSFTGLGITWIEHQHTQSIVTIEMADFPDATKDLTDVVAFPPSVLSRRVGLSSLPMVVGGSYNVTPSMQFSAPQAISGRVAEGVAVMSGSTVSSITITSKGSGYTSPPTFAIIRDITDTETPDAIPFVITDSHMQNFYLDTDSRVKYFRIRMPVEYSTPATDNIVTPSNPGSYSVAPVGVIFSAPDLPGGRYPQAQVIYDTLNSLVQGIELLDPGSGYLSSPVVTLLRSDNDDPDLENAVFDPLITTVPQYRVYSYLNMPVTSSTTGTLNSTWIYWHDVRYANYYIISRDGVPITAENDVKQLPFEDVGQTTADTSSYTVEARYNTVESQNELASTISFTGEPVHLDGSTLSASYSLDYYLKEIGPGDSRTTFWRQYDTDKIPNARRDVQNTIAGTITSPFHHKRAYLSDLNNTVQDYKVKYEVKTYLPAVYRADRIIPTLFLYRNFSQDQTDLMITVNSIETAVNFDEQSTSNPVLRLYKDETIYAPSDAVSYEFRVKLTNSIVKTLTSDGMWYLFWPSVPGNKGYHLYYQVFPNDPVEIPLPNSATQYLRDVVTLAPAVNNFPKAKPAYNEVLWADVNYSTGYIVYRKLKTTDLWNVVTVLTSSEHPHNPNFIHPTSYLDYALEPGEDYDYMIESTRDPVGAGGSYFIETRLDPQLKMNDYSGVGIYWNYLDDNSISYLIERRRKVFQDSSNSIIQATIQPGDGNDDGEITNEDTYVAGGDDNRESSEWVVIDTTPAAPYNQNAVAQLPPAYEHADLTLSSDLEYRVIALIPVADNNVFPNTSMVNSHILTSAEKEVDPALCRANCQHQITWPFLPDATRVQLWRRIKFEGDDSFFNDTYALTERYTILSNNFEFDGTSRTPEFIDTTNYSQPSDVNYILRIGAFAIGSGPLAKTIRHSIVTSRTFSMPWFTPGLSSNYQFFNRIQIADQAFTDWKSLSSDNITISGSQLTDSNLYYFPYAIQYGIKGKVVSPNTGDNILPVPAP